MTGSDPPARRGLPPALPPTTRTVGQVVALGIELYQRNFLPALALGIPVAVTDQLIAELSYAQRVAALAIASPAFSLAYAGACVLRDGKRAPAGVWARAVVVGVLTFLPAALFFSWFAIVALLYLGIAGHAVPAVMTERIGVRAALRRTVELGRADYVHATGSFATLALLFALTRLMLGLLLSSQADATVRVAIFLADLALAPLLFLGSAIVYVDLAARVGLSREERRRLRLGSRGPRSRLGAGFSDPEEDDRADVPDALVPDREGDADAQLEPRPAPRGQP